MNPMTAHTLDVPGARLHYEVRGSGEVLLLIPGGPADGAMFDVVVPVLTDDFTVVTYDPRGLSRSTLNGGQEVPVHVQADDAHRLLSAVSSEPAYVFGNSGGATAGLSLVTQHPDAVRTLVAHEPPITELLPDSARFRTAIDEVHDTYRSDGPGPAMQKFLAAAGFDNGPGPADAEPQAAPDPAMAAAIARMQRNMDVFFAHMLGPITSYRPDAAALQAASTRVVVGAGTESTGQTAHRAAVALANLLGTTVVDFPGGHGGFTDHPEVFARTLHRVLTETT
jgi:pimeloyl-ACP methyl ester carboxylesterase